MEKYADPLSRLGQYDFVREREKGTRGFIGQNDVSGISELLQLE
jgi:hypothetical protein